MNEERKNPGETEVVWYNDTQIWRFRVVPEIRAYCFRGVMNLEKCGARMINQEVRDKLSPLAERIKDLNELNPISVIEREINEVFRDYRKFPLIF